MIALLFRRGWVVSSTILQVTFIFYLETELLIDLLYSLECGLYDDFLIWDGVWTGLLEK